MDRKACRFGFKHLPRVVVEQLSLQQHKSPELPGFQACSSSAQSQAFVFME